MPGPMTWCWPRGWRVGRDAREAAFVEMWQRRMEFQLFMPVAFVFRHTHPRMAALEQPQLPEFAQVQRGRAAEAMAWLDGELATRPHVAGEGFTIADITAFVALELAPLARIEIPDDLPHLARWRDEVAARPSAKA